MGIIPAFNALAGFAKAGIDCLEKAEMDVLQLTKEARQKGRAQKTTKEYLEAADTLSYGPGEC